MENLEQKIIRLENNIRKIYKLYQLIEFKIDILLKEIKDEKKAEIEYNINDNKYVYLRKGHYY